MISDLFERTWLLRVSMRSRTDREPVCAKAVQLDPMCLEKDCGVEHCEKSSNRYGKAGHSAFCLADLKSPCGTQGMGRTADC